LGPVCPANLSCHSQEYIVRLMNEEYNLTSRDYADLLGITPDNLRKRRRREIETNYIQDEQGKYWWKRDRPKQEEEKPFVHPKKQGLFRVPGQKKIDTKQRNRGALARGDKSDYPNWKFAHSNELKALTKIKGKLEKDFTDEEIAEFLVQAKKAVARDKEKVLQQALKKIDTPTSIVPYGVDRTPLKYGTRLSAQGLARTAAIADQKSYAKWKSQTDVKPLDTFKDDYSRYDAPDFGNKETFRYRGPYEVGDHNDGSVEVKGVYEGQNYSNEPVYKNKIEESIARARLKYKK